MTSPLKIKSLSRHFFEASAMAPMHSSRCKKEAAVLRRRNDASGFGRERFWFLVPIDPIMSQPSESGLKYYDQQPNPRHIVSKDGFRLPTGSVTIYADKNRGRAYYESLDGFTFDPFTEIRFFVERHIHITTEEGKIVNHGGCFLALPDNVMWDVIVPIYESGDLDTRLFGCYDIHINNPVLTQGQPCDILVPDDDDNKENFMAVAAQPGTNKGKVAGMPGVLTPRQVKGQQTGLNKKRRRRSASAPEGVLGSGICQCGCGGTTGRYFVPGHDARFKGWLKRIARGEASDMPKAVHDAYTWIDTTTVGGPSGCMTPTLNYDSSPND